MRKLLVMVLALLMLCGCGSTGSGSSAKSAELKKGTYVGGEDIPVGTYYLSTNSDSEGSGIFWLAAKEDDLDSEWPSLLYEYSKSSEDRRFFVSMQEGNQLTVPYTCTLTTVNYSSLKKGKEFSLYEGTYIGGIDLPVGGYVVEYTVAENEGDILWLAAKDDNIEEEYPSMIYEFIGKGSTGKMYLSIDEGSRLFMPFSCDNVKKVESYSFKKGTEELCYGCYIVGKDIPAGRYIIKTTPTEGESGILWASAKDDDLQNEYPSVEYEYIRKDEQIELSVKLEEGGRLFLPCKCVVEQDSVSFN